MDGCIVLWCLGMMEDCQYYASSQLTDIALSRSQTRFHDLQDDIYEYIAGNNASRFLLFSFVLAVCGSP